MFLKKNSALFKCQYRKREREREREGECERERKRGRMCVCVCVCEREREREIVKERKSLIVSYPIGKERER